MTQNNNPKHTEELIDPVGPSPTTKSTCLASTSVRCRTISVIIEEDLGWGRILPKVASDVEARVV